MSQRQQSEVQNFFSIRFSFFKYVVYICVQLAMGALGLLLMFKMIGSFTRFFFWFPIIVLLTVFLVIVLYCGCFLYSYYLEAGVENAFFRHLVFLKTNDPLKVF